MLKSNRKHLSEASESIELIKSKPIGISKIMTFLFLGIVIIFFIWAALYEKSIYITCSGKVEISEGDISIYNTMSNTISTINVKDGDTVYKGEVLIYLNCDEYLSQKNTILKNLKINKDELEAAKKLKETITDYNYKFIVETEFDELYYKKYQLYLAEYNNKVNSDKEITNRINSINDRINNLNLLQESVKKNINLLDNSSSYYYKYNEFKTTIKNFDNKIEENQSDIKIIENEKEIYINNFLQEIYKNIEEYTDNLDSLLNEHIAENYKNNYLVSLDSDINSLEKLLITNQSDLDNINNQIKKCTLTAPQSGTIILKSDFKIGDYINCGEIIGDIYPNGSSNYKIKTYIECDKFANIKENQSVVIELNSLPASTYGTINSKLNNISLDANFTDDIGNKYYTANCYFKNKYLKNKEGDDIKIKNGMNAKVKILTRKVSYLRFFLEQINFFS